MEKSEEYIEIQSVMDALDIIGGKWKFPILFSLCSSTKRFSELQSDLKGISPRALSNALKDLEVNDLVTRKVFPEVPIRVEYSLTEYGAELRPVMLAIQKWGKNHRKKIFGR
ncbi:MAG: helix-turn-helix domain-containing protein [Bacteroidota bacterium]